MEKTGIFNHSANRAACQPVLLWVSSSDDGISTGTNLIAEAEKFIPPLIPAALNNWPRADTLVKSAAMGTNRTTDESVITNLHKFNGFDLSISWRRDSYQLCIASVFDFVGLFASTW